MMNYNRNPPMASFPEPDPQPALTARLLIARNRFQKSLLAWYDRHARDLPWRKTSDPYRVWVSEIMLQQTRVAAVIAHYHEFLKRFPTVEKLASARLSSVLAAWSGLGYYRRTRMLHQAAKLIVREHRGKFPQTSEQLQNLPGIGRYTSAAIASIAFGEPVPVVDGNVERVLLRFTGKRLPAQSVWAAAGSLVDTSRPGDFNQAIMELGATVCTPRSPGCPMCPVHEFCATRGHFSATRKPVPQRKREIHYALACRDGKVFLVQRPRRVQLMPEMWELPEIARGNTSSHSFLTLRHSITTTDYTVNVWRERVRKKAGKWIPLERLQRLPLTGLARKILRAADILVTSHPIAISQPVAKRPILFPSAPPFGSSKVK